VRKETPQLEVTAEFHPLLVAQQLKFLLPQRPDGGTMQHVTASQVSFSNAIGEARTHKTTGR